MTLIEKAVGTPREQDYVAYTYTPNGKREFVTDANGNKAKYQYDGFDRQTHWWFPSKTSAGTVSTTDFEQYGYDANGNRTSLRKRDGRSLTFAYDAMNRMSSKAVPDGCAPIQLGPCTPASATRDVFYSYDIFGRQLTAKYDSQTGADGLTSGYDIFGNLTSSTISMGGFSKTLTAQYDLHDNRTRLTHPDSAFFDYAYDAADRMGSATENGAASLASFAYAPIGDRSGMTRGGSSSAYGYDGAQRLTSLAHDLASTSRDVAWTFGYGPSGQLATTTRDNDAYAWNGHADVERLYAVNGLNQYTIVGAASPTYDANGNLITDGTNTYVYDAENRLVSATAAGATATLTYDPMGRLWQLVKASANTRFLTDGDELVGEYDGTGALSRRYVHGPGVDEPVIWYEGASVGASTRRQLLADRQGSIVGIADSAGTSIGVNSYDEYGIPAAANIGRFQYTGQTWLSELGLYYYKARFYSPYLGRFLQVDPIGYEDQVNLYAYVGNDPLNLHDPSGERCLTFAPITAFCVNAQLYANLDRSYNGRTSFFAAASIVSETLNLSTFPFSGVSSRSAGYLAAINRGLGTANFKHRDAIVRPSDSQRENDRRFVRFEQGQVQRALDGLQKADATGYKNLISEVNSVLNGNLADESLAVGSPFADAISNARESVGGSLNFANEAHRIAIGDALTDAIRNQPGRACNVPTGSRISRC